MNRTRSYIGAWAAFLALAVPLRPAATAQDLPASEVARLAAERAARAADPNSPEARSLDRLLEPGRHVKGELIVRFKPGAVELPAGMRHIDVAGVAAERLTNVPSLAVRGAMAASGVRSVRRLFASARPGEVVRHVEDGFEMELPDLSQVYVLTVPLEADLRSILARFKTLDEVIYADPNAILTSHGGMAHPLSYATRLETPLIAFSSTTTTDPLFSRQWGMEQSSDEDIDAEAAWLLQTGNSTVKIGIVDSGIDYLNPDLGGAFGSGKKVSAGYDYVDGDADPRDQNFHGTHVAGIAAALTNNGVGVSGVAGGWNYDPVTGTGNLGPQLVALRAIDQNGDATVANLAQAVYDAANPNVYGANVINNSYGGNPSAPDAPNSAPLRDAFRYAALAGRVLVVARGNSGTTDTEFPAEFEENWIVSVGATDEGGNRANESDPGWGNGSSYGGKMDVVAPGTRTLSTTPIYQTSAMTSGRTQYNLPVIQANYDGDGNDFTTAAISGTSMAAPHVTGIAALIYSEFRDQSLSWHPEVAQGIIKATAEDRGPAGYDAEYGHGRVNAAAAVARMRAPYTIVHAWTGNGTQTNISGTFGFGYFGGGSLAAGNYLAKRYTLDRTVPISGYTGTPDVYCRGLGTNVSGWSPSNPNNGTGYCAVTARTATSFTVRTYVYELWTTTGQYIGFYPQAPANTAFHYTLNGIPTPPPQPVPLTATMAGPSWLGWKQTGTWTAQPSGGNGAYAYTWYERTPGGTWNFSGTGASFSKLMIDADFEVRVDVVSGSESVTLTRYVNYDDGSASEGVSDLATLTPTDFDLSAPVPNPSRGASAFRVALPEAATVRVTAYDALGRAVATLHDGALGIGVHRVRVESGQLAPGVYVVRMEAAGASGAHARTQRLTVLR